MNNNSVKKHGSHRIVDTNEYLQVDGDKIVFIPAKGLNISWGNDCRFWKFVDAPKDGSSGLVFLDAAELVQVNWLEVRGRIDLEYEEKFFSPEKTYAIFYIIMFKTDAFGWDACPISHKLTAPNGHKVKRSEHFERYNKKKSSEDWRHVFGGEFSIGPELKGRVDFGMYENKTSYWKGGMILHGVQIKPKN